MKKKQYMTPATKASKLECVNMMATSTLGFGEGNANDSEVLSNQDVWSDGLW